MASPNSLIVEVIGDTTKLKAGLRDAQGQIRTFSRTASTIRGTGADALLADVRALRTEGEALQQRAAQVEAATESTNAGLSSVAKGSLIAGVAVNVFGRNLGELGGTAGRVGKVLSELSTGNIVGAFRAADDNTEALSRVSRELIATRNAAKATELANTAAAAGFDDLAESARNAAAAIRQSTDAFVDVTKIRDSTSPGAIADEVSEIPIKKPPKRKGITAEQRNTFFDAGIARELDRVQDVKTVEGQVSALQKIAGQIQKRIDATKDITRKLNLEDQLVAVRRQQRGVLEDAAADARSKALAQKRAAKIAADERRRRAEAAAEERRRRAEQAAALKAAREQARQSIALGDFTPSVENLRKQLKSISQRLSTSDVDISSKLKQNLAGARHVLAGEFGKATLESRKNIQDLFDAIRGEFDKEATKGPLTKTTGLDTKKILAGLGLSPADERELRSRLSHFNSAGITNVRSQASGGGFVGGRPIVVESHTTVQMDSQTVGKAVTRSQQKKRSRNPSQRRGPNRGLIF